MKTNYLILFTLSLITLQINSTLTERFQKKLQDIRKSLFPTTSEILKVDEIQNPFLKETTKLMIDKKQDGVYLLYNLIYYNFLLNLNKFCLLRYSLNDCNKFHAHANGLLTTEINNEKTEVIDKDIKAEEKNETVQRIEKIENQDYFNIASVYEGIFKPTGDDYFNAFLVKFKQEFEEKDENFNNDAESLLSMYQDNLVTLENYLNEEKIDESEQLKKILDQENSKNYRNI